MIALAVVALVVAAQDTNVVSAVRSAAEREPVETFGDAKGTFRVRDVRLLDVDGDGSPEAFVWIDPSVRQTPTILVYTYDAAHGPKRILEGLVAGELTPVSGRLLDDHTMGYGVDLGMGQDGKPVDIDRLLEIAMHTGMSLVRYRTFVHCDARTGFVSYVDLFDRSLPGPATTRARTSNLVSSRASRLVRSLERRASGTL